MIKPVVYIPFFFLIFLSGCGRKQPTIFNFEEAKKILKVDKLELPAVYILQPLKTREAVLLMWRMDSSPANLIGFNVYRFERGNVVPIHPLNEKLISNFEYWDYFFDDFYKRRSYCYLVRPVFRIEEKFIEGIASKIVCVDSG